MNSESKNNETFIPEVKLTTFVPEKSKKLYGTVYKMFMEWRKQNNIESFTEQVLLSYFEEVSKKYQPSSLWAQYSMLKSTLNINNDVNIHKYVKLRAFLKFKSKGFKSKKPKTFTTEEINRFIQDAPDDIYLVTKVALIMGVMGACRAHELYSMSINDLQDLKSAIIVTVSNTPKQFVRKFTITGNFYQICKKYLDIRPPDISSLFLNYQKGKCIKKNIGINKFGVMGKEIARYLKLPNPEMYTAHAFKGSSKGNDCSCQYISHIESVDDSTAAEVETNDTTEPTYNLRPTIKKEVEEWESTSEIEDLDDAMPVKEENEDITDQFTPVKDIVINDLTSKKVTQNSGKSTYTFLKTTNTNGSWQPSSVTQDEINNFMKYSDTNKSNVRNSSESTSTNERINFGSSAIPSITLKNCSNMTIILVTNSNNT